MGQKVLTDSWEVVKDAIGSNKGLRINWKALLGESIDSYVFRNCYLKSPAEMIRSISMSLNLSDDALRKLKINVNSSFVRARKRRGAL